MKSVSIKRGKAKLTAEQESALVAAYAKGADTNALAKRFGIDVTTVRRYVRRARAPRGPNPEPSSEFMHPDECDRARIERLTAYDRRDLTGIVCGDPPVGFSALEQKACLAKHEHQPTKRKDSF